MQRTGTSETSADGRAGRWRTHRAALVAVILGAAMLASCNIGRFGPELNVYPPGIDAGITGWDYGFQFQVIRLPRDVREVTFTWSFSGDPDSERSETVPARFRRANHTARYRFSDAYVGELTVTATAATMDLEAVFPVTIGLIRGYELAVCGDFEWKSAASGGHGTTRDTWNIEAVPVGAVFDIDYDAHNKPDRYMVYYADELVLDTGWRGRADYDSDPTSPLEGPGVGSELGMFAKGDADTFLVTIDGPRPGTIWDYRIRCRVE